VYEPYDYNGVQQYPDYSIAPPVEPAPLPSVPVQPAPPSPATAPPATVPSPAAQLQAQLQAQQAAAAVQATKQDAGSLLFNPVVIAALVLGVALVLRGK
jgi:hypothetical protein